MKKALVVLITILVLALASVTVAETGTLNVTVIGTDGTPVSGASVYVIRNSTVVASGETDTNGTVSLTVDVGYTYLVVAKWNNNIMLGLVDVATSVTNVTLNASAMKVVNLTFEPITDVTFNVIMGEEKYNDSGNRLVYATGEIEFMFPQEIEKYPYKYVLKEVVLDGESYNTTTITVVMDTNHELKVIYERQWAITGNVLMWSLIIAMLGIAIVFSLAMAGKLTKTKLWRIKRKYVEEAE